MTLVGGGALRLVVTDRPVTAGWPVRGRPRPSSLPLMGNQIGFDRAQDRTAANVQAFRELYEEITQCRRGFDSMRNDQRRDTLHDGETWAQYTELKAVLADLGIPFPIFEEHDPQWNCNLLHSLFLQKLATFARLGKLQEARALRDSEEWENTWSEYADGPPVGG